MLETLVEESRRARLKLLVLDVYASNTRVRHVYSKPGFREAGTVPKMVFRIEGYVDTIGM